MKKLYLGFLFMIFCVGATSAQEIKDSFEVFFELDKAILKEESKQAIDAARQKTEGRRLKVRINGHACDLGTDNYNMTLSEQRAQSTLEYLKSVGEAEDKIETFFFGEKEKKYDDREQNRRVFVLMLLEDDDKDAVVKDGCAEVFIEKGSYKPKKTKDITFTLRNINTAAAVSSENISMEDKTGRKLYANSIIYYSAKIDGQELDAPQKALKIKLPLVNEHEEGFNLYRGENQGGKIVWVNTGKPCEVSDGTDCKTYNFDWTSSGYCACAQPKKCEEDCSENPFGGEKTVDLKAEDIRYSGENTVAQFPDGVYPQDLADLNINILDDNNLDKDLDVCEQFMFGITTDDWFPTKFNVRAKKNIIITATGNDGATAISSDANKTMRIMIPRDKVSDLEDPILVPGITHSKGYIKWDVAKYEQTTCLGPINCDYVVFDVPATGNYKLGDWKDGNAPSQSNKYVLKTRLLKESTVLVGNTKTNVVYRAKSHTRKDKVRPKEYDIKDFESAGDMVILVKNTTKKSPLFQEAKLSDLIFKKKKNMYVMRKRDFKKIADFKEMQLDKCK